MRRMGRIELLASGAAGLAGASLAVSGAMANPNKYPFPPPGINEAPTVPLAECRQAWWSNEPGRSAAFIKNDGDRYLIVDGRCNGENEEIRKDPHAGLFRHPKYYPDQQVAIVKNGNPLEAICWTRSFGQNTGVLHDVRGTSPSTSSGIWYEVKTPKNATAPTGVNTIGKVGFINLVNVRFTQPDGLKHC